MPHRSSPFDPLIFTAKSAGNLITLIQECMQTLYDGIVPPLLGYRRLQNLIDGSYSTDGIYTTESHNNSGFYLWEREAIGEYLTAGKRFMVLAAGGGREVIALLRRGVHVEAWECNARLREYGNRLLEQESLPCHIQPMEPNTFPAVPKGTSYDFCIVGWSAYCHILRREDRIALLAGIKKVVNGPILISFVGKKRPRKLKRVLRDVVSRFPVATKDISYDLVARPGVVSVGFDEKDISEEAAATGLVVKTFKNHRPEYPYALLVPKE